MMFRSLGRDFPRLAPSGALAGIVFCLSAAWAAPDASKESPLRGAVTVAGKPVEGFRLERALSTCARGIDDLAPLTCLERFWVPRFLLDAEAEKTDLAADPRMAHQRADILHRALYRAIFDEIEEPSANDVDEYIERHRRDFQKPLRIRIHRILVNTPEEARTLLREIGNVVTVAKFRDLARAQSVDHATAERGGDLGFVWPDGSTDVPQVSAEKSLYRAASELEDGQLASEPVAEGKRFAVLFRTGSLPEVTLTNESRVVARQRLREASAEAEIQAIVQTVMDNSVQGRDDVLLGKLRRKDATLFQEL